MPNIPFTPESALSSQNIRRGYQDWVEAGKWHYFITLSCNRKTSVAALTRLVRRWDNDVNRKALGTRYWKHPEKLMHYIGFPERLEKNAHAHLVVRRPIVRDVRRGANYPHLWFRYACRDYWETLVKKGSFHIEEIDAKDPLDRISSYVTKESWLRDWSDRVIYSAQFQHEDE